MRFIRRVQRERGTTPSPRIDRFRSPGPGSIHRMDDALVARIASVHGIAGIHCDVGIDIGRLADRLRNPGSGCVGDVIVVIVVRVAVPESITGQGVMRALVVGIVNVRAAGRVHRNGSDSQVRLGGRVGNSFGSPSGGREYRRGRCAFVTADHRSDEIIIAGIVGQAIVHIGAGDPGYLGGCAYGRVSRRGPIEIV